MHTIEQIEYIVATNVVNTHSDRDRETDVYGMHTLCSVHRTLGTAHPQYGYDVNWMLGQDEYHIYIFAGTHSRYNKVSIGSRIICINVMRSIHSFIHSTDRIEFIHGRKGREGDTE